MSDPSWWETLFKYESGVISQTPFSFVGAVAFAGAVIWIIMKAWHARRHGDDAARIALRDDQIRLLTAERDQERERSGKLKKLLLKGVTPEADVLVSEVAADADTREVVDRLAAGNPIETKVNPTQGVTNPQSLTPEQVRQLAAIAYTNSSGLSNTSSAHVRSLNIDRGTVFITTGTGAMASLANSQKRADVRVGFVWDNEEAPETAGYRFHIFTRNLGPANADVSESFAAFLDDLDGSPDFRNSRPRQVHTVIQPGLPAFTIYEAELPDGKEGQFCYGFVRWSDGAGKWERGFCVHAFAHPPRNQYHFVTMGGERWNYLKKL